MILTRQIAAKVADGQVDRVFRRWATARVHPGHRFRSTAGIITVDRIDTIDPNHITDVDVHAAGAGSVDEIVSSFRGSEDNPVFRIGLSWVGPDPRSASAAQTTLSPVEFSEVADALQRLDSHGRPGPWTMRLLDLISEHPGVRAAELAMRTREDKDKLKRDVRKLKNLGLTLSLSTGYRLSARGVTYMAHRKP
ncbi:hypothetical protein ACFWU5_12515 [Nocardia sp. NPDC058640]|uniref:hypothetical protein n=1 Tax=Nocardia sp. NPDC058640 TaxID=3346571 RepID=UPI0036564C14